MPEAGAPGVFAIDTTLRVRVKAIVWETDDIKLLELRAAAGEALPPFTAGAHLDLHLPTGLVRSYSLVNAETERHRYVIGVARDRASRGGSRWLHDTVRAGDILTIGAPRNNFRLDETAPSSVLVAGGIGITPIMSMVRRLAALRAPWQLHYGARARGAAAFLDELAAFPAHVRLCFEDETGLLDLPAIVAGALPGSHFYGCGPPGLMAAFEAATAALPPARLHREYFTARAPASRAGGFVVELARSGRVVAVPAGKSIIEALEEAGIAAAHSCRQGVCGTCEVPVVSGIPDHRDGILTDAERAAGKTMMICCSGARSERLVLDL
jgi:tetrachlorobenzoquinone reductase